jgi:2-keto-3-deoxy-L-rhamnonate aldolase RhmA
MSVIRNPAKQRLLNGEIALGLGLWLARAPYIAKIAKITGHDWIYIDMEHNGMSIETALDICAAALDAGVAPIVRVPGHEHFHASRVLDGGAWGIQIPHVNTADEARRAVANAKFPPIGQRSMWGTYPQIEFQVMSVDEMARVINDNTIVSVMIETPEAVENIDEIAAVDGVDVVHIGTNDLLAQMGLHGQFRHPKVEQAFERLIAACKANGKFAGMGGFRDIELMQKYIRMGVRWLTSSNDLTYLITSASERAHILRETGNQ